MGRTPARLEPNPGLAMSSSARARHLHVWIAAACVLSLAAPALAATGKVGVTHALTKVRPSTPAPNALVASLSAARNEFEAFQVVVQALDGGVQGVSMSVSALNGPDGAVLPASRVVLYREALYPVVTPSSTEGAKGDWPDPLIPDVDPYFGEKRNAFPFDVPAGESRAVWVDVFVPPGTPPGGYTGAVTVTGEGIGTVVVPVQLHVRAFELPSTASLKSAYGMGWDDACEAHHGSYEKCGYDAGIEKYHILYARAALDHRISLETVVYHFGSYADFDKTYGPLLNGTAPTRLVGAKLTTLRLSPPASTLAAWKSHFDSRGWGDVAFDYTCDEPPAGCPWSSIKPQAELVQAAGVPSLVTTDYSEASKHGLLDNVDILVPIVQYMHPKDGKDQRGVYDPFLAKSSKKQLWWYQSCISHGCGTGCSPTVDPWYAGWPSYAIDSSAIQNRAMEWLSYKYDIQGELYFQTTHMLTTAWTNSCDFSGNGDGTLFYPGTPAKIGGKTDIPVESIRMKLIREGMEDYEYLLLLQQLGDEAFARSTVTALFPQPSKITAASPEALYAARESLASRIEALTPLKPPPCTPLTCAQAGVQCGTAPDGCDGTLQCGGCDDGDICGLVAPNTCSPVCVPSGCDGACGAVPNGCGATIQCGGCGSGETCGVSVPNVCGPTCVAKTCAGVDAQCGNLDDGCGGTLKCGDCPTGMDCGTAAPNKCTSACAPKTCAQLGAQCGSAGDGCGGTLKCGGCAGGKTCGLTTPNICGSSCKPTDCDAAGAECGSLPSGCGAILQCGSCPAGWNCGVIGPNLCSVPEVPTLDVPAAAGPITVDGQLGEWDAVTPLTLSAGQAVADFQLMWTPDALYVAVSVADQELLAPVTGRDAPALWQSDGIEIMLDPALSLSEAPDADDRHIILSVLGDLYDATGVGEQGDPTADLGLIRAVTLQGGVGDGVADAGWHAELRIPWAALLIAPDMGRIIGADLAINDASVTGYHTTDWAGLEAYAQPAAWHRLRLAEAVSAPVGPGGSSDASDGPDASNGEELPTPGGDVVGPPGPLVPTEALPSKAWSNVPVLSSHSHVQPASQGGGCNTAEGAASWLLSLAIGLLYVALRRSKAADARPVRAMASGPDPR
ncbi:MAG: DUF4091 domain-containing protein [Myxococcota bacterium]